MLARPVRLADRDGDAVVAAMPRDDLLLARPPERVVVEPDELDLGVVRVRAARAEEDLATSAPAPSRAAARRAARASRSPSTRTSGSRAAVRPGRASHRRSRAASSRRSRTRVRPCRRCTRGPRVSRTTEPEPSTIISGPVRSCCPSTVNGWKTCSRSVLRISVRIAVGCAFCEPLHIRTLPSTVLMIVLVAATHVRHARRPDDRVRGQLHRHGHALHRGRQSDRHGALAALPRLAARGRRARASSCSARPASS